MTSRFVPETSSLTRGGAAAIDLTIGGQGGPKRNSVNWDAQHLYVKGKARPFLLRAPGGFRWLPDSAKRVASLKRMVEVDAVSVTGLNSTITNEFAESLVNKSEVMQTLLISKRERSNPVFTWELHKGKPEIILLSDWSNELMQDTESDHPAIIGRDTYIAAGSPDLTLSDMTMSVAFAVFNDELTGVVPNGAYVCTNMAPMTIPDEATNVRGEAGEVGRIEVPFTALTIYGKPAMDLAQAILDSINKEAYAVDALTISEAAISADVAAAATGFNSTADALAATLGE